MGPRSLASQLAAVLEGATASFTLGLVDADGARTVGCSELAASAWGFAAQCRTDGARPGDVIAIAWRHDAQAIAAWAGAVLGGFVPTFVPPEDPDLQQRLGTAVRLTVGPGTPPWPTAASGRPVPAPEVAIVQRTSGTTGVHRTIALSHARVLAQTDALASALALDPRHDRIASCLPLHHDMGLVSTVLLPLLHGVPCIHVDPALWRADAPEWLRVLSSTAATLTWLPPAALARMTRLPFGGDTDLSALRQVVCGGEVVTDSVLREFVAHFAATGLRAEAVGTGWGMAENVAAVTHSPPGRAPSRLRVHAASFAPGHAVGTAPLDHDVDVLTLVAAGPPIHGTEVRIGADGGHGEDVVGELHVRGICQADPDVWSATGDVGLVHAGEVFVCGRLAELLHVDGRWILPHEAEQAAASVDGVRPGRVAAIGDGQGGFVVLFEREPGHEVGVAPVADAVERRVHRRPQVVCVAADSLPRNTAGKSCRSRCIAP